MHVVLRPYRDSDAEEVVRAFAEWLERDATLRPLPLDEWRAFTSRSFNNGARDFAVACEGGHVIALLMCAERDGLRNFRIVVDPRRRREGIGARLFDLVTGQGPADETLQASCPGNWAAGMRFLERREFAVTREVLWMSIADLPAAPNLPDGVRIRPYAGPADDEAWSRINDAGYGGGPEHSTLTPADLEVLRAEPRFHLWMAECGGDLAGLCHTKEWAEMSTVESLVVVPAARGRGLGRALLLRGLRTLREQSPERIHLTVRAENEHAAALYRSVGFRTDDTMRTYQRPPGPEGNRGDGESRPTEGTAEVPS